MTHLEEIFVRKAILFFVLLFSATSLAAAQDNDTIPEYTLPDVLTAEDGTKIETAEQWREIRRPEILELFRKYVFGRGPGRPDDMHFEVVQQSPALDGLAVYKEIHVCFTKNPDDPCMRIHLYLPAEADGPVPVFVGNKVFDPTQQPPMPGAPLKDKIGGIEKYTSKKTSDREEKPIGRVPGKKLAAYILKRGYGFATTPPDELSPDDPETWRQGVLNALEGPAAPDRPRDAWGTIGVWAWGLSRALDYFETDPDVDATRVIAIGHSRRGKTALWAGAQDQRFALVISNDSGCTGAAISRRRQGETVEAINNRFPHWFCENYKQYDNNEDALPIDQHELLALIAPRPLYVASGIDDDWADPDGEFLSTVLAGPVYELFGKTGVGITEPPAINYPVGDFIGYHVRSGGHGLTDYDWLRYLDFADRHLK